MADAKREAGLRVRQGLRVLVLALVLGVVVSGCSGGEDHAAERDAESKVDEGAGTTVEDALGHQAYQPSTRLVVPAAEGTALDRVARVAAGLSEGPLGAFIFVDQRPGQGGLLAWHDVSGEEPDGHQLAYVTEGLLATDRSETGVGLGDLEMAAQTDSGFAVLVVKGDPEIETLQGEDFERFADFVEAAKEDPGLVEVADPGPGTVYRAGTLALEREAGIDLAPKSLSKTSAEAIYDGDVEAALVPADEVLTDVWAGELRAIAVLGDERCADLPNVPTAKELGFDVGVPVFGGIAVPAGTPDRVVEQLGRGFVASSSSPVFDRALLGTGRRATQRGPEEFVDYVEGQTRLSSKHASRKPGAVK